MVEEFKSKDEAVKKLKLEIKEKNEESKKSAEELTVIEEKIHAAQEVFDTQMQDLKLKLDECMIQNHLSWDKVNKVLAILSGELGKTGLSEDEIEGLSQQVVQTGSLIAYLKDFGRPIIS